MGQKVSPEIFRLENLNNNWKLKYIENKTNEFSSLFFKSLEIKNFIARFMKFHGLTLHNCKLAISNTALHLIIFYYVTNRVGVIINRRLASNKNDKTYQETKKKEKSINIIKNIINTYYYKCFKTAKKKKKKRKKIFFLKKKVVFNKLLSKFKKKISFKYLHLRKKLKRRITPPIGYFQNSYFRRQLYYVMQLVKKKLKTKKLRSKYKKKIKERYNIIEYKNYKNLRKNSFSENFLKNLAEFVGKKYSLFVTIKNLKINNIKESYLIKDAKFIKKKLFFKLYKYKKSEFFKIAKRTLFIAARKKNSAQFLADFISFQLNRLKKEQYFFLKCIKSILATLLKGTISSTKLSGIKIIVNGRLKKARRAKNRTFKIIIGRVPLQSIHLDINHAKATSYTPNGTFGTEVWINYSKAQTISANKNFFNNHLILVPKKPNSAKNIKTKYNLIKRVTTTKKF